VETSWGFTFSPPANGLPLSVRHSGWRVLQLGTPAPIATKKREADRDQCGDARDQLSRQRGADGGAYCAGVSARLRSWPMGLSFFTVVFDADDPQRVGHFWAAALERELIEGDPGEWATLSGDPRLDFMKVPENKSTKNRVHIDWHAPDREAEVKRLIGLGATRLWDVQNENFEWTTLADVEGNEFCVVQADRA